tara:strand:+ start:2165 stop:2500 length:336 start_codon:yes stop_codon:yes gene_type:complete
MFAGYQNARKQQKTIDKRCYVMQKCEMDFPHQPIWCPACWSEKQKFREVRALEEANRLKQLELSYRVNGELDEVQAPRRPAKVIYKDVPPIQSKKRGGLNLEPTNIRDEGQ